MLWLRAQRARRRRRLAVPGVAECDGGAWFLGQGEFLQLDVAGRWLAVDADDHVARAQPGLGGRPTGCHRPDMEPFWDPGVGAGRRWDRHNRQAEVGTPARRLDGDLGRAQEAPRCRAAVTGSQAGAAGCPSGCPSSGGQSSRLASISGDVAQNLARFRLIWPGHAIERAQQASRGLSREALAVRAELVSHRPRGRPPRPGVAARHLVLRA